MKKLLWTYAVLCLLCSPIYAQEITVPFAAGEWAPYISESLPQYGAAGELVFAICKAAGIKPVITFYPWARAELMVEEAQVFAAFPYAMTEERKKRFVFSDIMYYGVNQIFYYVKNERTPKPVNWNRLEDLKEYLFGFMLGSFFEDDLKKAGLKLDMTIDVQSSLKKLKMGRIDFFIEEQVVAYYAIKMLYPAEIDDFKTLPKPYGEKMPNCLIVSDAYPNAAGILEMFNKGLKIIRHNGVYDRIIKKHRMVRS